MSLPITADQIKTLLNKLHLLTPEQQMELLDLLRLHEKIENVNRQKSDFVSFVKSVWPAFIEGPHHTIIGDAFNRIANGTLKRLIIAIAPRHGKSELGSIHFPAWLMGKFPDRKIIQCSNTAELAVGFGRKVRDLVSKEVYANTFPDVKLKTDSKAAGRWSTNAGGDYFAIGVGGAVTGKGADCAYFACKCLTRRGILRMSEVRVGDEVLGYDHGSGKSRWTRVLAVSTQLKPELVNVGGFICTPEHRIYTGRGYSAASDAREVAVLPLWNRVLADNKGTQPKHSEVWAQWGGWDILFKKLRHPGSSLRKVSRMWRVEGSSGKNMQELLPKREAYSAAVRGMRENIFKGVSREKEGPGEARGRGAVLLQSRVLRQVQMETSSDSPRNDRDMRNVRVSVSPREAILRNGLLREKEGDGSGVLRRVEFHEAYSKKEKRRGVRVLRKGEVPSSGPPYRPQREKQHIREHGLDVRPVPRQISSHRLGACAEDFKHLLLGSGYWVVDIQTDTGNFFSNGVLAHNCLIIDDAHSEQEAKMNDPKVYEKTYSWYMAGPRQRLQPNGSIIIINTRWSKGDITGRLIDDMTNREGADQWEYIELPAIMPDGQPLWPDFWKLEELLSIKASLPVHLWQSQYMQQPTAEESAIIKREWWRTWTAEDPPKTDFIIQSWDTAFLKTERADYSACTTWGVFSWTNDDGRKTSCIILLDAYKEKLEFPELKKKAVEFYKYWKPDSLIVEAKAAGSPLIHELRRSGIPVQDFNPGGQDKIARLNAVSDIFQSGMVFVPPTRWAEEVIEEVADFPFGRHDDLVDSTSQALLRFRRGGFIKLPGEDEEEEKRPLIKADYY
jgi:predicted phage terminase large subunit-like protein